MQLSAIVSVLVLAAVQTARAAFYVPGVAPESWEEGEKLPLNTLVPYEYYYLPFCAPSTPEEQQENLGEIMSGDAIMDSMYALNMNKEVRCQVLCKPMTYTPEKSALFVEMIENEYYVQWVLDNLPVLYEDASFGNEGAQNSDPNAPLSAAYHRGFPVGEVDDEGKYFLYNHVRIVVLTHPDPYADVGVPKWRVVGFEVVPTSIRHEYSGTLTSGSELESSTCGKFVQVDEASESRRMYLDPTATNTVLYTYDVQFVKSDISWENRWDRILSSRASNDQIH
ncbi:hypothetical protein AaE_000551, partial [Aphanomyces astaci]